jgi:hypothetical protein
MSTFLRIIIANKTTFTFNNKSISIAVLTLKSFNANFNLYLYYLIHKFTQACLALLISAAVNEKLVTFQSKINDFVTKNNPSKTLP